MHQTNDYSAFAVEIAKQAGGMIRSDFKAHMEKSWKSDESPVTRTDIRISNLVLTEIEKRFPKHSVLGEEMSRDNRSSHVWVVDPVDGTVPFSHGVPISAFSLALVIDGAPTLGVIYDPFLDRLLTACQGSGAFLNGSPIMVSGHTSLEHTAINFDGPCNVAYNLDSLPQMLDRYKAKITKFSCLVYGGMLVALGEYVAAICTGEGPWDIAALKIIVEEAGGRVTDINGNDQRYDCGINGALISNNKVHSLLNDIVSLSMSQAKVEESIC